METREITLAEVLEARERRAARQMELLRQYGKPLVSFSMNIAGPVKNGPLIRRAFRLGEARLRGQLARARLSCVHSETIDVPSGCEGLYVADANAKTLKRLAQEVEDFDALGRLFDMDVLSPDGVKLERERPRRCLICGADAKVCASRRLHTVPELQAKTREILENALETHDAETVGNLACRALLYEVCVTPKPGLVDRRDNGSHSDMDIYTFMRSASALRPYFERCARIGRRAAAKSARETFDKLRLSGKLAEIDMLSATGGANAHKGAIFSMGLVCGAAGRLDRDLWREPERVLSEAAAIAKGLSERDFASLTAQNADTNGKRLYVERGITGIRGEAEAGFPSVLRYGLPVLERGLAQGKSNDEAGAAALLSLLAHTTDTNIIARSDTATASAIRAELLRSLDAEPYPDAETLRRLNQDFVKRNLSPGGSADLLSLCWMLHFLREVSL
ncbi:MAG: citrate lyase holo-[Oscillospiraceae bacterium]|nr:citrate lyase holo-[acyl-carrier protein] synthase [Oscillospiraceae bacterium]